jgi:DNA polymerase-3 subunit gamma/tau
MSYVIFARKFRPQTFDAVVGQEPIVTTLKNAIRQERIPQNFLFSGPRGIGKTSTARILAKALNCAKGPTETPCGKCQPCLEITQANSLDVLEIDGASNRGIDEIRNLRETVKFNPASGRFKIYIIDEVHMLTTEAFNALLKTLEEPPAHVKFIFATTESHKVPLTILSRCQRFNFKRISTHEIAAKLEEIAKAEKLKFDKKAVFQIAKFSEGALRDGESLLDQLASFSEEKIKEEDVLRALGLASEEVYFSLLSALHTKDVQKIFAMTNDLYDNGHDMVFFAKGLLELFRNLLLLQCGGEGIERFIEISEDGLLELTKKKNDFTRGELLLALSLLGNLQGQLRRNLAPPKLLVETALLKLLHVDNLQSLENLSQAAQPLPSSGSAKKLPAGPRENPISKAEQQGSFKPVKLDKSKAEMGQMEEAQQMPSRATGDMTLNDASAAWPRVVEYVKAKRMSVGIFLSESEPVEISDGVIVLGLPSEFKFHKDMLEKDSNRQLVEEAFEVISGKKVRVQVVTTVPEEEERDAAALPEAVVEDKSPLPDIITQALEMFEGSKVIRKEL